MALPRRFNLEKAHIILDEMVLDGCIVDTNKACVRLARLRWKHFLATFFIAVEETNVFATSSHRHPILGSHFFVQAPSLLSPEAFER